VYDAPGSVSLGSGNSAQQDEALTLLDILLGNTALHSLSARYELPMLSPGAIVALPTDKQSRYYFLMGLIAKQKQDLVKALDAFERALALAPDKHRPAILDELGVTYYTSKAYQAARGYHLRALNLLENDDDGATDLRFKIELHCGDDYRALGAHREALEHYEHARLHLNPEHDMKTAGLLYMGLGYCTYILIHQKTALFTPLDERATSGEMEREFQRALSFLLQSRSVYQVSGDGAGEVSARLMLAMVLLNFSTRQRQMLQAKADASGRHAIGNCTALLNDAEEQCRQVLLTCQDLSSGASVPIDLDASIYVALAYLVRIAVQRAMLARAGEYIDTAYRERAIATSLCQQVVDSLSESSLPWTVIHSAMALQLDSIAYQPLSLPKLPALFDGHSALPHSPVSLIEVFFAAGEVAEELGRVAASYEYCHDCYTRATQCFQRALDIVHTMKEENPDYLVRCYQRCTCILEERMMSSPEMSDETMRLLLNVLKAELREVQYPVLDKAVR
jgi:tetratricopeptide (TPR) repeat protein